MKSKQAKDFLVQQVADQASRENIPLSDIEKEMVYFTESDPTSCPNPIELNGRFESEYDTVEFESKMSRLLHHAYDRLKVEDPQGKRNWDEAIRTLRKGDHYFLVLWDLKPRGERPKGDFLKLVGIALLIVASITVAAIWFAKNNIDLDRYRRYSTPLVFVIVFLVAGGFRLIYRLALVWFHRNRTEDDGSN